jgi:lysophospholipase L1-like esterase
MRALIMNLAVLAGSLTIGMTGIEAFLQRYHPVASAAFRLDDRLLHELVPDSRRLFTPLPGNGGSVLVKVDAHGYRGNGFSEPRRGPRVVVYGDSFVEAPYTPLEDTFVARLQSELRRELQDDALETINAGVTAYGPDQSALRIEDEIAELAPDLLVFCVFTGNDFGDLLRNRLFRLGANGALVENKPTVGAELRKTFDDAQHRSQQPAVVRAARTVWESMSAAPPATTFPHYIDEAVEARRKEYADYAGTRESRVDNLLWDGFDADIAVEPESASARLKAALMAGVLARIDSTARAHRVPWLLVVIPDPIDVAAADFELQVDEVRYPRYDPRRLTSLAVGAAEQLGVRYVDLYQPLTETGGERLFHRHGDNHWNAAGQAKAAVAVAHSIASAPARSLRPALLASRQALIR